MNFWKETVQKIHNFLFGKREKPMRNIIFLWLGIIYAFYIHFYITDIFTFAKKITPNGDFYISYFNGIFTFIFLIGFISVLKKNIVAIITYIYNKIFGILSFPLEIKNDYLTKFIFRFVTISQLFIATFMALKMIKKGVINGIFIHQITERINVILTVILIVYFVSGTTRIMLERQFQVSLEKNSDNASILRFMNRVIYIIMWIVGGAYLLNYFGYNPMTLLAGAGIGGIAIAFGAQKSIANIFGAITILLNKPFAIEDYIQIGSVEGTVKDIGLTYVKILDRTGKQVMIPNETIITTNIKNYSQREKRLVEFKLSISTETQLATIPVLVDNIEKLFENYAQEGIIKGDYRVAFGDFGAYDYSINILYNSLIIPIRDHQKMTQEIKLEIKKIMNEMSILSPFPTTKTMMVSAEK